MPIENIKLYDNFWLKDNVYSLADMVAIAELNKTNINPSVIEEFIGGTVYQAFLSPWCYHKWHSPVSGKILVTYKAPGAYYLQNPGKIGKTINY
jgi:phosphatidylserine decarboxylase